MELHLDTPTFALEPGQVVSLDDAAGRRVLARTGTVWITEEDSVEDHIVGPGESLILGRRGRTVLQALQPACVSIQ